MYFSSRVRVQTCGRRRSLLVDVRLAAAPHAVPNAAPAAMGVLPDLLEHRRVLQHVRQDHEPDLAPAAGGDGGGPGHPAGEVTRDLHAVGTSLRKRETQHET